MISHDRAFLNRVAEHIVEIDRQKKFLNFERPPVGWGRPERAQRA